jgi:hypothetical protein
VKADREGDIIVTAVGGRYAIGRLKADREMQESLGSHENRAEALQQACALAGATAGDTDSGQRVT